jgi:hypothetical protein
MTRLSNIVLRGEKGVALTWEEADQNFVNLDLEDQTLLASIAAETSRAQAAETSLSSSITNQVSAEATSRQNAIAAETSRAQAAETSLASSISSSTANLGIETSRAQAAESSLQTAIITETSRASAAEASLSSAIITETSRASNAESSLQTAIITETSRATAVEASKQATLVSGTNIKTINGSSVLGSGNLVVSTVGALDDLSDVTITSAATNDVLKYNGTAWINGTAQAAGLQNVVEDLSPQLGGDLDLNAHEIVAVGNDSVVIGTDAAGFGAIYLQGRNTGGVNINATNGGLVSIASLGGLIQAQPGINTQHITFDNTRTIQSTIPGDVTWNNVDGTLEFLLKGGNVNLQIGQEQVMRIHNNTGSTLTDGQIVYITGAIGERPTVALASASSESTSSKTIGVVTESIANGADGFVTTSGLVHGLNTNAFNEGDAIWLSTTAGQWSTTRPTQPNHGVFVGWIVKKSGGNGSIYVHVQNGYELDELHDVLIGTKTNQQALTWNSSSSVWQNSTLATFDGTSVVGANAFTYQASINAETSRAQAAETSIASSVSAETSRAMAAEASLASAIGTGGGASALDDLTDVTLTSAANNELLKYDGTGWVNTALKTINGSSIIGSGDIEVSGGGGGGTVGFEAQFLLGGM